MNHVIRCAIYDRVSTDMQVKEGLSLDAQRKALTDYAISHGYQIVDYYADEGITARKKMQNRKELVRLLNDVKSGKIDLILVTKLDRWFRNIKDYHNTQTVLEAHGCNWKTIFEEYDTTTSNGRFAINIMLSVNENECDRDSDRIKETNRYKISVGEVPTHNLAYFGYKINNKHLVIDELKRPIVEDIYKTFLSNYSKHTTYKYCLDKYGELFSYQTFKHFFTSEIYAGQYKFNKSFCPAYLTAGEWEQVQKVNERNIRLYDSGKSQRIYLYSGLLKCPNCGRTLSGSYVTTKYNHTNNYYRCWKHRVDKSCDYNKMVSELWLENYLKQNLLHELTHAKKRLTAEDSVISTMVFDIKMCKKELERLNSMYLKGRIPEEKYDAEYERLTRLLAEHSKPPSNPKRDLSSVENLLNSGWMKIYDYLDGEHKRSFWHGLIDSIEMTDNRTVSTISFV